MKGWIHMIRLKMMMLFTWWWMDGSVTIIGWSPPQPFHSSVACSKKLISLVHQRTTTLHETTLCGLSPGLKVCHPPRNRLFQIVPHHLWFLQLLHLGQSWYQIRWACWLHCRVVNCCYFSKLVHASSYYGVKGRTPCHQDEEISSLLGSS